MKRLVKITCSTDQDTLNKIRDIANQMTKVLDDNRISNELWDYGLYDTLPVGIVTIHIRGDWKHDHLRANYLLKENFDLMPRIDENVTEDTGEDWYPATHTYYVLLPR